MVDPTIVQGIDIVVVGALVSGLGWFIRRELRITRKRLDKQSNQIQKLAKEDEEKNSKILGWLHRVTKAMNKNGYDIDEPEDVETSVRFSEDD